jgi:RNA polymerase sigma-70 factor (ECF subfamily)
MDDREVEVLRRVQRGDRAALEILFRRYADPLWRYAWARTHARQDAADIVQETFLRVWKAAGTYGGRASVSTWLFAVARSAAIDHVRQRMRRSREQGVEPTILKLVPAGETPAAALNRRDDQAAVREAVAKLPGGQRDAVVLCELCDMTIRDAAGVLGWSETRVRVTLFRARARLRAMLEKHVGGGGRMMNAE